MYASGIGLRAIQALEARTRVQNDALVRENEILQAELAALRERLSQLEARQP
jgi:regulator of replication initiation timing